MELICGTIGQISVYPREFVKTALQHNAAAVIFRTIIRSGNSEPSHADKLLTQRLKKALALVDVRTLDHRLVSGAVTASFAEHGLLSPPKKCVFLGV